MNARTRNVRWVCGTCSVGTLGPSKPRRDNIVRYCLDCSRDAGKLVLRVAPALERARTERVVRTKSTAEKAAERRAVRLDAYYTVAGVNLRTELASMLKCPVFLSTRLTVRGSVSATRRSLAAGDIDLRVRRASTKPNRRGVAWSSQMRMQITDFPGVTRWEVLETLMHELTHIMCYAARGSAGRGHGPHFKTMYRLACEQHFGVRPRVETRFIGEVSRMLREREEGKRDAPATAAGETS